MRRRIAAWAALGLFGVACVIVAAMGGSLNVGVATVTVESGAARGAAAVIGGIAIAVVGLLASANTAIDATRRRQVAAIPYRRNGEPWILLVKTTGGRWTFPKGNLEPDLTPSQSAEQEAWQEAGVRGKIDSEPFTAYIHQKTEWKSGRGTEFDVDAFLLEVSDQEEPREPNRSPEWVSIDEAAARLAEGRSPRYANEFARVLNDAKRRLER